MIKKNGTAIIYHDDVIKWKHFPHYWPFVPVVWSSVNYPHKGQWSGALMFSLICAWTKGQINNQDSRDLRRHHAHHDATVMHVNFLPNRLVARILQCISPTSHNAPLCNRNMHTCAYFCYKVVHSGIFVWCIMGLRDSSVLTTDTPSHDVSLVSSSLYYVPPKSLHFTACLNVILLK